MRHPKMIIAGIGFATVAAGGITTPARASRTSSSPPPASPRSLHPPHPQAQFQPPRPAAAPATKTTS
jgi:hypothetical protein